jgi:hypothetical protein
MHKKHGTDKFAAVSVSLDDPGEDGVKKKVLEFLESKKATFTNLILDEKPKVWKDKLDIDAPPCVFVFNQKGERVKKFADNFKYEEVEKLVDELMKKK